MVKLALIGDQDLASYSLDDRLWELISILTDQKIRFEIIPLSSAREVISFFEIFRRDPKYRGFCVAPPWHQTLLGWVDKLEDAVVAPVLSAVYKDPKGEITGASVLPIAVRRALARFYPSHKTQTVLVIGSKGKGLGTAYQFQRLGKTTFLFDPQIHNESEPGDGVRFLANQSELLNHKYDLIINMKSLGRHYVNFDIEAFTLPIDLEILGEITHPQTIVQETNCLPATTLLTQMAEYLNLRTIRGAATSVYAAAESLTRFLNVKLNETDLQLLIDALQDYAHEREVAIMEPSPIYFSS